jgi:cytochrome c553
VEHGPAVGKAPPLAFFVSTLNMRSKNFIHGPRWLCVITVLWAATAHAQSSADIAAGRQKANACTVCHGQLGVSTTPDAPHLAGQPAIYVAAQLRAYRSGARKHEVMAVLAKALSDDEINQLAAWYSSIRIEAAAP